MKITLKYFTTALLLTSVEGFDVRKATSSTNRAAIKDLGQFALSFGVAAAISIGQPVWAADMGASSGANAKITTGGASTLQSGRTIAITR